MARPRHNTTQLPRTLREELGIPDNRNQPQGNRRPTTRKELRKAEKAQKRARNHPTKASRAHQSAPKRPLRPEDEEEDEEDDDDNEQERSNHARQRDSKRRRIEEEPVDIDLNESDDLLNEDDTDDDTAPRIKNNIPRSVQEKLAEDDAEIARLEKMLGIKGKKKLPKSFAEDGLDDLLLNLPGGPGAEEETRKQEEDEWLAEKRRRAQGKLQKREPTMEGSSDEAEGSSEDEFGGFDSEMELDDEEDIDEEEHENETSDYLDDEDIEKPRVRENPYVAPVTSTNASSQKYVPPSLRARSNDDSESMTRLRRQAQGHLNKLSDANLVTILREFEKLYTENPRQNVTTTVINLLFDLIYTPSFLQDSFIILHAGFITAMYRVIGMDFGAEFLQRFVERFDADYTQAAETLDTESGDKETGVNDPRRKSMINAVALLSHLYNFHMIGCGLMFDYIKLFLSQINGMNTEFLLKVIKSKLKFF